MAKKLDEVDVAVAGFQEPDAFRRSFLKLAAMGGGALAYSVPAVKAFARPGAEMQEGKAIQILLPSTYSIRSKKAVLQFAVDGKRVGSVAFTVDGRFRLTATNRKNIADIEFLSMRMVSVEANPLPAIGKGRITASCTNTKGAQLNLADGRFVNADKPFALGVSYSGERSPEPAGVILLGGTVRQVGKDGKQPAQASESYCECLNDNDVQAKRLSRTGGRVTALGMAELVSTLLSRA